MPESRSPRPDHRDISLQEIADRIAIRELIDIYAYSADKRDAETQMSLFTEDAHFVVYMDGQNTNPTEELHSRKELAPVFADLNKYSVTTHFNGQSTILKIAND